MQEEKEKRKGKMVELLEMAAPCSDFGPVNLSNQSLIQFKSLGLL